MSDLPPALPPQDSPQHSPQHRDRDTDEPIFHVIFQGREGTAPLLKRGLQWSRLWPWIAALGVHAILFWLAIHTEPSLESWGARMATLIHNDLAAQAPIKVDPSPVVAPPPAELPPPPTVEPEPPPPPSPPKRVRNRVKKRRLKSQRNKVKTNIKAKAESEPTKPAPAETATIIAATVQPKAPVDLTDSVFITGQGQRYAGGVSTAQGTSKGYVAEAEVSPQVTPPSRGPSKARGVSLSAKNWRCEWPSQAMNRDIYEQSVILKVVVRSDGSVSRARAVKDPGDGFGDAAVACALRTRFTPALDQLGKPVSSSSPPIRVRFTR